MTTWITRLDGTGSGPRLAVKDLIDIEGVPTTAACRAVAQMASPAEKDAPLMAGARAADARIVGKANLHELAFGATGVNPWFGTPQNPLDPSLVPGGSSSGSAVAVATDEADVAYGSDTGGSVRIPAACCGTTGLKTTHGRISIEGVWPLAPSLDTIGPMARDVDGLVLGMQLLEPGFEMVATAPTTVGRFRVENTDPEIDAAIDRALAASEFEVVDIDLPGWQAAWGANSIILIFEACESDGHLAENHADSCGDDVIARLEMGKAVDIAQRADAERSRTAWQAELASAFERVQVIALPTLPIFPPAVDAMPDELHMTTTTGPGNLAGIPGLALPVPTGGRLPASIQLIGPHNSEDLLLAAGKVVEVAVS